MKAYLIFGNYGGHNTGDEAMLCGLLEGLAAGAADARFLVATRDGGDLQFDHPSGTSVFRMSLMGTLSRLADVSDVVLGGGTHFHDDYAFGRLIRHWLYLARIVTICWVAKLRGRRVYWVGMGFGPFRGRVAKALLKLGLRACTAVSVRDPSSGEIAEGVRPGLEIVEAFDLASLMSCTRRIPTRGRLVIGVSLTSLARSGYGSRLADAGWITLFAEGLGECLRHHAGATVRLFVVRGGEREDDEALTRSLANELIRREAAEVEIVDYQPDPRIMADEMAGCTHFVASRFHSALLAYMAGCELFLVSYHDKVQRLGCQLGVPEQRVFQPHRGDGTSQLGTQLTAFLRDPNRVRLEPATACEMARRNVDLIVR